MISNLQSLTSKIQTKVTLDAFKGQRVGVDGNLWLHRGAVTCAQKLALKQATTAYIDYFMEQVSLFQRKGVVPVIVFSDMSAPLKSTVNKQKERTRKAALSKALTHLCNGELESAKENFEEAIEVKQEMIDKVVKILKSKNVIVIHAGYEVGPQLTYLCTNKFVKAVVSEDYDLLVYGCPKTLFQMDANGDGLQICHKDLFSNMGQGFDFTSWDHAKFRQMYVLSGCDYLSSLPGMNLYAAYRLFTLHDTFETVIPSLNVFTNAGGVTRYVISFVKAEKAYLYQYVYSFRTKSYVPMTALPRGKTLADYQFLGDPPHSHEKSIKKSPTPFGDRGNLTFGKTDSLKPKSKTGTQLIKNPGKENIAPNCRSFESSISGPSVYSSSSQLSTYDRSSGSSSYASSSRSSSYASSSRPSSYASSSRSSSFASSSRSSSHTSPSRLPISNSSFGSPSPVRPSGSVSHTSPPGSPSSICPPGSPSNICSPGSPSCASPPGSPYNVSLSGSYYSGSPCDPPSRNSPFGSPSIGDLFGSPYCNSPFGSHSDASPPGSPSVDSSFCPPTSYRSSSAPPVLESLASGFFTEGAVPETTGRKRKSSSGSSHYPSSDNEDQENQLIRNKKQKVHG